MLRFQAVTLGMNSLLAPTKSHEIVTIHSLSELPPDTDPRTAGSELWSHVLMARSQDQVAQTLSGARRIVRLAELRTPA